MPLEAVQLDTLNWDQMVSAIRTRIVADSRGQWTLHAPVDPGVTLLELYAWLLDQRVYWMDQVPDDLVRAILALLGESPNPAQPAVTVLQFDSPNSNLLSVPAGTAMRLRDSNPPIIFSTTHDLAVLPLKNSHPVSVTVDGLDRTTDLSSQHMLPLLSTGKESSVVEFTVSLQKPLTADFAGQFFCLMIDLEVPKDVPPQWSAEAVSSVPPPAVLTWSYRNAAGTLVPLSAKQIDDGTCGLRRSGVVKFALPGDWAKASGTDTGTFAYTLSLQISSATYSIVPRLRSLLPNVALARHTWQRTKRVNIDHWLPLPGNVISLPDTPGDISLVEFPPIENTVNLKMTDEDGQFSWQQVQDFSSSGPADRVFSVDRTRSTIGFGDGLTGRLPVPVANREVEINYQAGGGLAGNVGNGSDWEAIKLSTGNGELFYTATNVVPAEGGKESEPLNAAARRAQALLNERNRAVTNEDYVNLVQSTPGVAFRRAYAAVGYHPLFPCSVMPGVVTVFVVPYAPRIQTDGDSAREFFIPAPMPDTGALQAARTRLESGRLLGSEVYVEPPDYRPAYIELNIASDLPLTPELCKQLVVQLQAFLDPLTGGDDGEGWPFGGPLRPSSLFTVAQRVLANAGDVVRVSISLDSPGAGESCLDVKILPHQLLKLEDVTLHVQKRTPTAGGLR